MTVKYEYRGKKVTKERLDGMLLAERVAGWLLRLVALFAIAVMGAHCSSVWAGEVNLQIPKPQPKMYIDLTLGGGHELNRQWGEGPGSVIRVRACRSVNWALFGIPVKDLCLEHDHHSDIWHGKPFKGKDENTADQWSAVISFRVWER